MRIARTTNIEEFLDEFPGAVKFLIDRKLPASPAASRHEERLKNLLATVGGVKVQ